MCPLKSTARGPRGRGFCLLNLEYPENVLNAERGKNLWKHISRLLKNSRKGWSGRLQVEKVTSPDGGSARPSEATLPGTASLNCAGNPKNVSTFPDLLMSQEKKKNWSFRDSSLF